MLVLQNHGNSNNMGSFVQCVIRVCYAKRTTGIKWKMNPPVIKAHISEPSC